MYGNSLGRQRKEERFAYNAANLMLARTNMATSQRVVYKGIWKRIKSMPQIGKTMVILFDMLELILFLFFLVN